MTVDELHKRVYGAVSAMTGRTDITKEYLNGIQKLFTNVENDILVVCAPDEVIINTLNKAPSKYDGKTRFPLKSFWENLKAYEQRSWNNSQGIMANEYIKPTEEEREKNRIKAHEITVYFESIAPVNADNNTEGKQSVTNRRKLMIEHLKKGEVQIIEIGNLDLWKWVPKNTAIKLGLLEGVGFYNPTHYLKDAKEMGRFGTVKVEM